MLKTANKPAIFPSPFGPAKSAEPILPSPFGTANSDKPILQSQFGSANSNEPLNLPSAEQKE
jgi:hypothetical protein